MSTLDSLWDRLWPSGSIGLLAAVAILVFVKGPKFWASALFIRNRAQRLRDAIEEQQIKRIQAWNNQEVAWRDQEIARLNQENANLRAELRQRSSSSE